MDKYHIFEFKTEELHEYTDKDEALKDFAQLKKDNPPGIWQLFCNHKMIDEFIGGGNAPLSSDDRPDYRLVGDKCVEKTCANDKKRNMAYWDTIDDICYEAVRGVSALSQTEIDEDELEEAVTEIGAEIRDIIIEKLKAIGGEFPFVDENY